MSHPSKESGPAHVLVVEDSSVFREMQELLLGQAGYRVSSHENPQSALAAAATQPFELVVIDYELPQMNGQEFMHALRKIQPDIAVIFVSGSLTLELAIQLSNQGVAGIFNKPANPKTLLEKINETLARHAARDTAARVGSGSPLPGSRRGLSTSPFSTVTTGNGEPTADRLAYNPRFVLGSSDAFREFTHRLWKVRDFRAVLLLQGEAGSPFELLARELAEISMFRDGPIMVSDAAHFEPRKLIEILAPSLLSHDAGTFVVTGVETFSADQQKTLENLMTGRDVFLPFARRFRLVLAATPALSERVDDGTFGETLYYKTSSLTVSVPTLRDMRGDVATNARQILVRHRADGNPAVPVEIADDVAEWMKSQDWPGNYDELARTVINAAGFAQTDVLTLEDLAASWPAEEAMASAAPRSAQTVAAVLPVEAFSPSEETRPPFPISSALAGENAPSNAANPGPVASSTPSASSAVARAPAGQLFSRPAVQARAITAHSLFRPASTHYSFTKRLTEMVTLADPSGAH